MCIRDSLDTVNIWGPDSKVIFRHYATLYFIFVSDTSESELAVLDLIQIFVETLDKNFESVCELDLIFHSDKIHYILDEIIMGGLVVETSINEIMSSIQAQNAIANEGKATMENVRERLNNMNLTENVVNSVKNLYSRDNKPPE
eukprot:TRINITY_DN2162_c0_g1_i1.p1 TRINITY_DN2162_c0_g1~~TRINITY_DN2162_c0_g1_i1.p1  ORF type:complete len:144 (+),score=24.66 TRINITY_DN2162_c0_g1_i1:33-464(+)